jgi:hypothetical protein
MLKSHNVGIILNIDTSPDLTLKPLILSKPQINGYYDLTGLA